MSCCLENRLKPGLISSPGLRAKAGAVTAMAMTMVNAGRIVILSGYQDTGPIQSPYNGDGIDLDAHVAREPGCFDRGSGRRILREIFPVHFVHARELAHVLDIDCRLEHTLQPRTARFKKPLEILQYARRLGADIAFHHLTCARIERDLAAQQGQTVVPDRLEIGPVVLGGFIVRNSFFLSSSPVFQNGALGSPLARSRSFPAAETGRVRSPRATARPGPRMSPSLPRLRSSPRS